MVKAYSYIRFSSTIQTKGDSRRRQLDASVSYAKKHNLDLVETLDDFGVSAYTGANATEGALNLFLKSIEDGRIEKGSILIIESLDRLSRQAVLKTLTLFTSILESGVEIVTLTDDQHYTAQSITEVGQLMFSIMTMNRAHQESDIKSKRGKSAWDNKRRLALEQKKPMTRQCPSWLKVSEDMTHFIVLNDRVEIIKRIFQLSINGTGQRKIATILNEQGVTPFNKTWNTTYIREIIKNKSLLGEYQPKHRSEAIGNIIKDYYPAVIDQTTFYKAQAATKQRQCPSSAGRKGKVFSNLFTGMCKCVECGSTYRLIKLTDTAYYTCDSSYMKTGCSCDKRWRLKDVESAALIILTDRVDWFSALGGNKSDKQNIESELHSLQAQLTDIEIKIKRYALLFEQSDNITLTDARNRYVEAMEQAEIIKLNVKTKENELKTYTPVQTTLDTLNKAFFMLNDDSDSEKLYEVRTQINSLFKRAGLCIYFNQSGVFYYVTSTQQKGIIQLAEHTEEISIAAELDVINHVIEEIDNY